MVEDGVVIGKSVVEDGVVMGVVWWWKAKGRLWKIGWL